MKGFWTAFAVALAAIFVAAGCSDYGNTFQVPTGARISSLAPGNIAAGSPQFTLGVNGSGFVAKTVVQWNGQTIATQLLKDSAGNITGITATVPASLVAKPGTAFVNTLSPHSGAGTNGLSNSIAFVIDAAANPLPAVASMTPSCAVAGGAAFMLTVTGSNFVPSTDASGGAQVRWTAGATQTTLTAASVSATQIQATVSSALIGAAGSASVSVFNPPSVQTGGGSGGGGTSQTSLTFTISSSACPAGSARAAAATSTLQNAVEETPAVSADGRFVAYTGVQNGHTQVFVRDTCQGGAEGCQSRTVLVSAASDGAAGNDDSRTPSITADGRYVAFSSAATNLIADTPAGRQVYLHDSCFGAASSSCTPVTQLVSTDSQGALTGTEAILPSVSASGRFVAFVAVTSHAGKKESAQTKGEFGEVNSGYRQVFVRDTCLGAVSCAPKTTRISLQPGDGPIAEGKQAGPALAGGGGHVALADAQSLTVFSHAVAVDGRVFVALTDSRPR